MKTKKIIGVILIVVGVIAFVTPFTPGSWLFFVGLEIIGFRFAFMDEIMKGESGLILEKIKNKFRKNSVQ
ncbi:MAG: hypothetical protein ACD_11C00004G0036 [uncultured bacterium]|nr:MAG: hypothetical protein ACD_11C00004G0036 [uncultured bacterium]HBR71893.1 hypothetical protein [Candidatus Moranbacteria bacterium]